MKKSPPSLAGWSASFDHAFCYAGLSDCKAKLEQLAVDAWRSPQRVLHAHPPDHPAQFCFDPRPPSPWVRLLTPIATKARPMPTHERLRADDCQSLQNRRKPAIHQDEEPAIVVREPDARMQPAPQDIQLMSKHRVLSFKSQLRLEWRGQDGQNETEQLIHSASLGDSITSSTRMRFSVHTGPAGTVRADQRMNAPAADLQVDTVHGGESGDVL